MLYIDLPTQSEIADLATERAEACVSIYLPTTPVTQDAQADRIELKNLLKAASAELHDAGTDKRAVSAIEAAVEELIADDEFWAHQARSLALFATPDRLRTYRLPNRLEATAQVADRFHVKPLLRAVAFPHSAYVLVLAAGGVRLVEVSADLPPHRVHVPDMPRDAQHALGRRTIRDANFPGGGGEGAGERELLTRYARRVDSALRPVLSGHERPLILAAAEPLASIWRRVNSYPNLADEAIGGNAERLSDGELAGRAREILDGIYAAELRSLAETFEARRARGYATGDIAQAARAATFGAIETLVVDMDAVIPGTVDPEDGSVSFAEGASAASYGVADEIAGRALAGGARVIAARRDDVPGGGSLAALLRYPT